MSHVPRVLPAAVVSPQSAEIVRMAPTSAFIPPFSPPIYRQPSGLDTVCPLGSDILRASTGSFLEINCLPNVS